MGKGRWNHDLTSQNNYHEYIINTFPVLSNMCVHIEALNYTCSSIKCFSLLEIVYQLMFLRMLVKSQNKFVNVNFELFSESFLGCLT